MRRTGLLVIVLWVVSGPACQAGGKTSLPMRLPKFIQADNGLGTVAALRGGDFLTRVALHFMGMDPVVEWGPFPHTADLIPEWMDEPVVIEASVPGTLKATGVSSCGHSNLSHLAARLKADPPPASPAGLIHLATPASISTPFDGRAIYGVERPDDLCFG